MVGRKDLGDGRGEFPGKRATLPLVSTYNCLDGYFAHPDPRFFSIAETMQRYPTGGSIAAISPTGPGVTPDPHKFRSLLLDVMFKQNVREVGEALLLTKQQYYEENGGPHYLVDTMTLFGDPAMRLPAPVGTTYLPLFIMD